jgi:toxin ParE1/3/4
VIKVCFLPAAEVELLSEVAYYSKAREGTGLRFEEAVRTALSRVARYPHSGVPSYKDTRVALVKRFPFSVVYRPSVDEILVVAIALHRKRPNYWASRID